MGEIIAFLLFLALAYGFYHIFIKKDRSSGDLPDDVPGRGGDPSGSGGSGGTGGGTGPDRPDSPR